MNKFKRSAVLRRFDLLALSQVCERMIQLETENEELRRQLVAAEDRADFWHNNTVQLAGSSAGLTITGNLVRLES